jgi:hypothetical protein
MGIEYFDGFDEYSTAQVTRYWNSVGSNVTTSNTGRNGSNGLRITGGNGWCAKGLGAVATRTVGFAMRFAVMPSTGSLAFLGFYDSAATSQQVTLSISTSGFIQVRRGSNGGTLLGTSAVALTLGTWYYFEVTATIHPTAGVVTVYVNGVAVIILTGQNTRNTANTSTDTVVLCDSQPSNAGSCLGNVGTVDFDDFYCRDDSTMIGDCRVETVLATGNGATINWTPLAGSNWQEISRNPATDDASYNVSAVAGDVDLYTFAPLPTTTGTVQAVATVVVVRNDSAGTFTEQPIYRSGGTNYFGSLRNVPSTSYLAFFDSQTTDPNTSAAWTITAVNTAQYGIKRIV